jgi:hypothetical protein
VLVVPAGWGHPRAADGDGVVCVRYADGSSEFEFVGEGIL